MVVGDSHAGHLLDGLVELTRGKANIVALTATYCVPLIEHVRIGQGEAATARCQAINDYVFDRDPGDQAGRAPRRRLLRHIICATAASSIRAYAEDLAAAVRGLHEEGVPAIVIAGQVPTWSPWMRILVGREVLIHGKASEFSTVGLEDRIARNRPRPQGAGLGPGRDLCLAGRRPVRRGRLPPPRRARPRRRTCWRSTTATIPQTARSLRSERSSRR